MVENICEDLIQERRKCTFDIQELIHIIDGGEKNTLMRKKVEDLFLSVEGFKDDIPEDYLSHKDKYERAVKKSCIVSELLIQVTNNAVHTASWAPSNIFRIQEGIIQQVTPFLVHIGLFIPTILSQGTNEQQEKWLKPGTGMLGCYAQTELGHGSFLRGLETTATFDSKTDEFIIHSPTITSYKFWPGGLGHTANTCLLMAQLYIDRKCYGIHIFLAQIRDIETHVPLPGIKVGEIGPKMGLNTADNGFLGFDNYRIPRTNMLMKNAQVLRDGTYVRYKHDKLTYGSMVLVRVRIVSDIAYQLSKAATIAIRYSAVRHQSLLKANEPEPQVLDYVTQQHKLFISIASSHAFRIVGQWMWKTYTEVNAEVRQGNLDQLPDLHALSCCLKALTTMEGARLIESCRFACGGHGYLLSSNLPGVYSLTAAPVTYDGEYTVLLMQTARYLVKAWNAALTGKKLSQTTYFLKDYYNKNIKTWDDSSEGIIGGFKVVAAGKIKAACESIQAYVSKGQDFEDAWNSSSIQLVSASEAYARFILCDVYWNETQKILITVSKNLAVVLEQIAEMYLVYTALENCGDLLLYSTVSRVNIDKLQIRYEELLSVIRPNAVGLVDAFDLRDEILCSTLGAYDGRVYERLMEEAAKSPLNAQLVNDSFHKFIKPFMIKHKL